MSDLEQYQKLVSRFFSLLEATEESDSGKIFHPVRISSCRVQVTQEMNEILAQLKRLTERSKVSD